MGKDNPSRNKKQASSGRSLTGMTCQSMNTCVANIEGVVQFGANAALVATAPGVSTKTAGADAAGAYTFRDLPPGTWTLRPSAEEAAAYEYTPASVSVPLSGNGNTAFAPTMTRDPIVPVPPPVPTLVVGEEPPPVFAEVIAGVGDELTSQDTFTPDLSFDKTVAQDVDGSTSTEVEAFRLSENMGNEIDSDWSDFYDLFEGAPKTEVYQPSRAIILGPESFACDSSQPAPAQLFPLTDPAPTGSSPGVLVQEVSGYHSLDMTERVRAMAIHVSGIIWNAAGSTAKLSVRVQTGSNGAFVKSTDPRFSDPQGNLCTSVSVVVTGAKTAYQGLVYLPYPAFALPLGSTPGLEAVATLQVAGNAYATNGEYSFDLKRQTARYVPPATAGFGELKVPVALPAALSAGGVPLGGVAVYAVNGYSGCCHPIQLYKALEGDPGSNYDIGTSAFPGLGLAGNVRACNWNNFNKNGTGSSGGFGKGQGYGPDTDIAMRRDMERDMVVTRPGTVAIFIGHSFGGDSVLKVAKCLDQVEDVEKKGFPVAVDALSWCASSIDVFKIRQPGYYRRRVAGIYLLDSVQGREGAYPGISTDSNFDTRQTKTIPKQVLVALSRMTPYPSTLGTTLGGTVSSPLNTSEATAVGTEEEERENVMESGYDGKNRRALLSRELLFGIKIKIPSCCPKVRRAINQVGKDFQKKVVPEVKTIARKTGGYVGKIGSEILKNNLIFGSKETAAIIKGLSYAW